jgi:hypothetical protein
MNGLTEPPRNFRDAAPGSLTLFSAVLQQKTLCCAHFLLLYASSRSFGLTKEAAADFDISATAPGVFLLQYQ